MIQDKKHVIRIESILGGQSPTSHFARPDQFRSSLGIDPSYPQADIGKYQPTASGLLRPVGVTNISSTLTSTPLWLVPNPKDALTYVYDAKGSAYTINATQTTVTALSDGGSLANSTGNGCEYYDNYIYFAKNTTIARYGPLDGVSAFDGDYWATTLGKTPLIHTSYPVDSQISVYYPNHVMHRHSDGRLYIADVVGNQGTIHYIATKKVTVEGDTDDGSTYNKIQVGYGLWPVAMESYGSDLVIAFLEGNFTAGSADAFVKSKIAFWDTTSQNINKITWVEFPDSIVTALKNIDGVLYVASGANDVGFRVSRFVGGYTFEEVAYVEDGESPFPGGMDGNAKRLLFGSYTTTPTTNACVYSLGLQKSSLGQGLFKTISASVNQTFSAVTAIAFANSISFGSYNPIVAAADDNIINSIDIVNSVNAGYSNYNVAPIMFWSQIYRIGQPFKITKIRIPLAQAVAANMTIIPKIYTDDGNGTTYRLTDIDNTSYPGKYNVVYRGQDSLTNQAIVGQHNFWLELNWTGSALCVVNLPITIEYELIDD